MKTSPKYFDYPIPTTQGWLKYEIRVVWANLFTYLKDKITTNDMYHHINNTFHVKVSKPHIAYALKLLASMGYLSREKHGLTFKYETTERFQRLKQEYEDYINELH